MSAQELVLLTCSSLNNSLAVILQVISLNMLDT
jgi:hypothetical protein